VFLLQPGGDLSRRAPTPGFQACHQRFLHGGGPDRTARTGGRVPAQQFLHPAGQILVEPQGEGARGTAHYLGDVSVAVPPRGGQQDRLESLTLANVVRRLESLFQLGFLGRKDGQFESGSGHAYASHIPFQTASILF